MFGGGWVAELLHAFNSSLLCPINLKFPLKTVTATSQLAGEVGSAPAARCGEFPGSSGIEPNPPGTFWTVAVLGLGKSQAGSVRNNESAPFFLGAAAFLLFESVTHGVHV